MTKRFWSAVAHKGWDDNIEGIYDYYGASELNAKVLIINTYRTDYDKLIKFVEAVCDADDALYWTYSDDVQIDFDDNCVYDRGYGEPDVIFAECEYIGRRRFEEGDASFDDVVDMFVNNPENALPSWLEPTDGWEQKSCDFEHGWYGRVDNPSEILEKLNEQDLDVLFQIDYINPFATGFCVWTKEQA